MQGGPAGKKILMNDDGYVRMQPGIRKIVPRSVVVAHKGGNGGFFIE